jgi:hypothetical protein
MIDIDPENPFCFYLIALEGVQLREPIWFEYTEVELITSLSIETLSIELERSDSSHKEGSSL